MERDLVTVEVGEGEATAAVRSVEVRMLAGMTATEQAAAFAHLQGMIRSLRGGSDG